MAEQVTVEVAYAEPSCQWVRRVTLPTGSTVGQVVEASGLAQAVPGLVIDPSRLGIFARKVWGLIPRAAAAPRGPSIRPRALVRARSMCRRMASSRLDIVLPGSETVAGAEAGEGSFFDIVDEPHGADGCRVRNWDSCQFAGFTAHASGHNPRADQAARQSQRYLHKFVTYPEKFGDYLCTGCGNCHRNCPVNLGVLRVLQAVAARPAGGSGRR